MAKGKPNSLMCDQTYHDDCIAFLKDMQSKSVDLVLTDIPYAECNRASGGLRSLDKGFADKLSFDIVSFATELKRITVGSIYVFCGIHQISTLYSELEKDMSVRLCQWHKTNPSPMNGDNLWLSATENCVYGKFPGATFNGHCLHNAWSFNRGSSRLHPTQKPIDLFRYLIEMSSNPGDLVLDPCCGSGTTARACLDTGRRYLCIDSNLDCIRRVAQRTEWHEVERYYQSPNRMDANGDIVANAPPEWFIEIAEAGF